METFLFGEHGSQIRGETTPVPSLIKIHIGADARAARPTNNLNEGLFSDNPSLEKYLAIVLKCTKIAKESTSPEAMD